MKKLFLYSLALSALAFSCDDDTPDPVPTAYGDLVWENTLTLQGQEISLNSNENIPGTQWLRVEGMRYYISRMQFLNSSNQWITASEVEYFSQETGKNSVTLRLPHGSYSSAKAIIGLDSELNATDPNSLAVDHPLSSSKAMYWSWALKYKFLVLEGKTSVLDQGKDTTLLLNYHPGDDALGYTVEWPVDLSIGSSADSLLLGIDLASVFDGPGGTVDFLTENSTHMSDSTQYEIGEKLLHNFSEAFYLLP